MKSFFEKKGYAAVAAICAGLLVTVSLLPEARGELVYEDEASVAGDSNAARAEEREVTRKVVSTSRKAKATVQAAKAVKQAAPAVETEAAPIAAIEPEPAMVEETTAPIAAPTADGIHLSKSELMRRERVREELKNEDMLQERLEELRLRDERRRTEQLLVDKDESAAMPAPAAAPAVTPVPLQQEVISGAPEAAPESIEIQGAPSKVRSAALVDSSDAISLSTSSVSFDAEENTTRVNLSPRAGLSQMAGNQQFDVRSRYSAGLAVGVEVTDNVAFEIGYTYSEYGVSLTSMNPYVLYYQGMTGTYGNSAFETYAMKQNVFDAGIKVNVLGASSKIRPFVGVGAGYGKSFINFDNRIISAYGNVPGLQNMASDYEVSSFLGQLNTGVDVKISKNITVGALFKYHTVLSARENQPLYNGAFNSGYMYGYSPYMGPGAYAMDPEKAAIGGSLARASFYSILASVSFTF